MFIRFVVGRYDPRSGRRQGVLRAGKLLLEKNDISSADVEKLQQAFDWFDWFNSNLPHPTRFSLSARPNRKAQALSWFRSTAIDHNAKMRDYTSVLNQHGLLIDVLKTARPGYVVYEDDYQVVAYPFADTPC